MQLLLLLLIVSLLVMCALFISNSYYFYVCYSPLLRHPVMKEDFDLFYTAGADLVVTKPFKKDRLLSVLAAFETDSMELCRDLLGVPPPILE